MAFALPLLKPKAIDVSDLPLFDFQKFFNKEEIGKGGFGAVFTADYYPHGSGNSPEKVVVKKALGEDLEDKKNFVKEARILRDLQHPNIVNFKGICTTPVALILEYAYFDFMPFGMNSKVSSLSGFLATLNDYDCAGFDDPRIFLGICKDIATGLQYLHHKNVAHRDLKPANVLVSNQHYCQLSKEEIGKVWIECPMVCKLADFGESRSSQVQTKSILNSQTLRVNRGTPVYQAPEFLVGKTRLSVATIEDMKRADVWALGMSLFVLLNPSVKYPYHKEIERAMDKGKTCLEDGLWSVVSRKKIPLTSPTMFHLVLNSKANKAQPALVRSLFLLKNAGGGIVGDACLLQYHLTNGQEQVKIDVQTHGNCRKTNPKPFQPMKKSSLRELQEGATSKPSRQVYDDLRQRSGGICGSISLCDLPRGRHQVYDAKSKARERGNDDVDDLLKYVRDKEDLVLHHSDVPEDLWVLGTSSMCSELERSTSSDILSHPFSVDPTFSLGKFEVTPVVSKNLLLKSKRTGGNPIFLDPTMIHHSKSETTYQMLATTCVRKCSSLTNAKGFITDGETALQNAFQEQLKHSQSLRCFKHFENNCKNKLRDLGIKSEKDQKYFLAKTFGVRGKEEGIIDAVDGKDLRKRLRSAQNEVEEQERLTLGKDEQYAPKYWSYLNDNRKMIRRHMVDDVRRKAGLMDGENGKPQRCYTNCSESMNNIMKAAKNTFTKESGATHLTKLQFTRHVFEAIHDHQVEEFQSAVAGVSDEYVLADHSKYLQVPADVWFDWSPQTRNTYIGNIQKLSMEDIFQQKDVPWPSDNMSEDRFEFRDLEVDVAGILSDHFGYSADNSIAIKREVLNLVNHPTAIQPKASLATKESLKFEVASPTARNGSVLVTVYSDHVGCVCGRYRHDNICKHSIAVAARQSILSTHFNFLKKKSKKGSRTALAEYDVNKNTSGKKGARNKNSYRPERYCSSGVEPSNQARQTFTEIHHNENQFVLMFLPQEARTCKSCEIEFCQRKQVIPFNMVFAHKERWLYPVDGDWSKAKASKKETNRFYHTAKKCIIKRFPYFNWDYVEIPSHVADSLSESHRKYLRSEFQDAVV